jgi:hypothetical protein
MPLRPIRTGLLVGALGAAALVACTTATVAPDETGDGAGHRIACPETLDLASGAPCTAEGQSCDYLFPCATFPVNVICACSAGHYVCEAVDGGPFDDTTACPTATATETCPRSEVSAQGLFCAEPGLFCYYRSSCDSTPGFDTCQCIGPVSDSDMPHFECVTSCQQLSDATLPAPEAASPEAAAHEGGGDAIAPADVIAPAFDGGVD